MRGQCGRCGSLTIVGRAIDNAPIVLDAQPTEDLAGALLSGDPTDRPTVIWGITTAEDAAWYSLTLNAPRYVRHTCTPRSTS